MPDRFITMFAGNVKNTQIMIYGQGKQRPFLLYFICMSPRTSLGAFIYYQTSATAILEVVNRNIVIADIELVISMRIK